MKTFGGYILTAAIVLVAMTLGALAFIWSGRYDIGADAPHWQVTFDLMQWARDRSIRARSADVAVPNLDDQKVVLEGAGHYAAMCAGCHLAPGVMDSEIRPGLYPQPPNLSAVRVDPRDAFWVIKHGIKMSAMPAWGSSHDDATIWSMVAFVRKLPDMTPQEYKDIVAKAPPDDDMDMHGNEQGHSGDMHAATKDEDAQKAADH